MFTADSCGNPFNNVPTSLLLSMNFVDFDFDGDTDMVGGVYNQTISNFEIGYFDNAGDASSPLFDKQIGTNNPFNNVNEEEIFFPIPRCADLDADGDNDLLLGDYYGNLRYFENLLIPPVGVDQPNSDATIYPNPSDALFFIQMNDIRSIKVWNNCGQLLINKNANSDNYMLDLSSYSKGLYFIKIITPQGEFNHKLILK
jgi:hypothetical protein